MQETWVQSLSWEDPWRRESLPTPVFWPGELHGLYIPWSHKESDITERLSLSLSGFLSNKDCFSWTPLVIKQSRTNLRPCGPCGRCHLGPWTSHRGPTLVPCVFLFDVTTGWSLSWRVCSCLPRLSSNKCTKYTAWCLGVSKQDIVFSIMWMKLLEGNTLSAI